MGRKGRNRHGHNRQLCNRSGREATTDGERGTYVLTPKENKLFEQYYQGQKLVLAEEWDKFMATLRQPLPSTFRITGSRSDAAELLRIIKSDYLNELVDIEVNGRCVEPTKCLQWYPDELAWQLDLDRNLIRQNDKLKRLHQFLVQETESGHISRQEAVSMIPPLLLDVQSNSRVLDMCAAPGSKTAQLIEMLHAAEPDSQPEGFVIANDSDNKRCYLMVHQVRRLASSNFLVMNNDAAILPSFTTQESSDGSGILRFDRILCDVPCSGDGTLRKNVDAWQRWNPAIAHGLHGLQVRLLKRGVQLLDVGGRIVYSTCSLNPVEDEAVLCAVIAKMKGSVELVDVSDQLPGLVRENGVSSWRIMSKFGDWYETHDQVPDKLRSQILRSMFPPSAEQAAEFGLQRCIRILPHKQNSGGFFVAVLRKVSSLRDESNSSKRCASLRGPVSQETTTMVTEQPVIPPTESTMLDSCTEPESVITQTKSTMLDSCTEPESSTQNTATAADHSTSELPVSNDSIHTDPSSNAGDTGKRKRTQIDRHFVKKTKYLGYREDPFVFLQQHDPMWEPIQRFYGISSDFPFGQLMVRCEMGKKRNVYFVSSVIKQLVQTNADKFKFINLGVKVFSRSVSKEVDCEFRLVQDGIHLLFPYITKRVVSVGSVDDIVTLLTSDYPYIQRMSKVTQEQLNSFDQGGCVFVYKPTYGEPGPQCQLVMCGWKGKISCRSFLPKFERGHYLRLCGVELKQGEHIAGDASSSQLASASLELEAPVADEDVESGSACDARQTQSEKDDDDDDDVDLPQTSTAAAVEDRT